MRTPVHRAFAAAAAGLVAAALLTVLPRPGTHGHHTGRHATRSGTGQAPARTEPARVLMPGSSTTPPTDSRPPLLAADRPVHTNPHLLGYTLLDLTTSTPTPPGQPAQQSAPAGPAHPAVLADRCTGCTNHAASTVKIWLAGTALATRPDDPATTRLATAAIIDSDNTAATTLYNQQGGLAGLWRMVYTCHLTRTLPDPHWGATQMTAGDLATLAACAARGDIAGPATAQLLQLMRTVRGPGRFGIVDGLPPGTDVAYKNGWDLIHENGAAGAQWHVNCAAIIDHHWALAVITRYPAELGLGHGAALCADAARQLATPRPVSTGVRYH